MKKQLFLIKFVIKIDVCGQDKSSVMDKSNLIQLNVTDLQNDEFIKFTHIAIEGERIDDKTSAHYSLNFNFSNNTKCILNNSTNNSIIFHVIYQSELKYKMFCIIPADFSAD